mgnify:CR=1 FL=1
MSTPRSESIRLSKSEALLEPHLPRDVPNAPDRYKVERYAFLARISDAAIESFLADQDCLHGLSHAPSLVALESLLIDSLLARFEDILEQPDYLNAIKVAHSGLVHNDVQVSIRQTILHNGIKTYASVSRLVYSALEFGFGHEGASHPNNARLIDRLAKMNVDHLEEYAPLYLADTGLKTTESMQKGFLMQVEADPTGGYRFRSGFPGKAPISQNSRRIYRLSEEEATIDNIPVPTDTIGCPITFSPSHARDLWSVYSTAHRAIVKRQKLVATSQQFIDDSAGSLPAMA